MQHCSNLFEKLLERLLSQLKVHPKMWQKHDLTSPKIDQQPRADHQSQPMIAKFTTNTAV